MNHFTICLRQSSDLDPDDADVLRVVRAYPEEFELSQTPGGVLLHPHVLTKGVYWRAIQAGEPLAIRRAVGHMLMTVRKPTQEKSIYRNVGRMVLDRLKEFQKHRPLDTERIRIHFDSLTASVVYKLADFGALKVGGYND